MHRYAREAYNMGIRYIGACCGMEPYHVRAIAEEVRLKSWPTVVCSEGTDWARTLSITSPKTVVCSEGTECGLGQQLSNRVCRLQFYCKVMN